MSQRDSYRRVREALDREGFFQPLSMESLPLVQLLLSELHTLQDRTFRYKDIAQNALKRTELLKNKIEPLEKENTILAAQNHAIVQERAKIKEDFESKLRNLKNQYCALSNNYSDLEYQNIELISKLGALQELINNQSKMLTDKIVPGVYRGKSVNSAKSKVLQKRNKKPTCQFPNLSSVNKCITDILSITEPKELSDRVNKLMAQRNVLNEKIDYFKKQTHERDVQITSLTNQIKQLKTSDPVTVCLCHNLTKHKDIVHDVNCRHRICPQDSVYCIQETFVGEKCGMKDSPESTKKSYDTCSTDFETLLSNYHSLKNDYDYLNSCLISIERENCSLKGSLNSLKSTIEKLNKIVLGKQTSYTLPVKEVMRSLVRPSNLDLQKGSQKNKDDETSDTNKNPTCSKTQECQCDLILKPLTKFIDQINKIFSVHAERIEIYPIESLSANAAETDRILSKIENLILRLTFAESLQKKEQKQRETYYKIHSNTQGEEAHILRVENDHLKNEVQKYSSEVDCIKTENEMLMRELSTHSHRLQQINNELSSGLPGNKITDKHYQNYLTKKYNLEYSKKDLEMHIHSLEQQLNSLSEKNVELLSENSCLQSQYTSLRSINDHLKRSLKNAEAYKLKFQKELSMCLEDLHHQKEEKNILVQEIAHSKKETENYKEKLFKCLKDKDNLMERLDTKTIDACNLEKEKKKKQCIISQLEEKISCLNCQIIRYSDQIDRGDKEIFGLKQQLEKYVEDCSRLKNENRNLHCDLESVTKEYDLRVQENDNYKIEVLKLKEQVQNYVVEVRRVEQILETKELEREEMLEQFKNLNAEAMQYEILESEKQWANSSLLEAQEKIKSLEATLSMKDTIVEDLENQIRTLSDKLNSLRNELFLIQKGSSLLKGHTIQESRPLSERIGPDVDNFHVKEVLE